jgi:hypothetical protein
MELVRYVLPHLVAGCAAGVITAVALVATNIGSLRDLMLHTQGGWLAFALLTLGCALTLGSAAIGHAIMTIADDED